MTDDELFAFAIRSTAAILWTVRLARLLREGDVPDWSRRVVSTACLAALLAVIALGGLAAALELVPGAWIATAYTATSVVMIAAGAAVSWGSR